MTKTAPLALWLGLVGLVSLPSASASAAQADRPPPSFCPPGYSLLSAMCMNPNSGDVVLPATRGEAYLRIKATHNARELCSAWDVHIVTQIEDFANDPAFPTEAIAAAAFKRMEALSYVKADRYADALAVYETIFADIEGQ